MSNYSINKVFIEQLEKLLENAMLLDRLWEEIDPEFEQELLDKYPFEYNFKFVVSNLIDWYNSVKNKGWQINSIFNIILFKGGF